MRERVPTGPLPIRTDGLETRRLRQDAMTTAQTMLNGIRLTRALIGAVLLVTVFAGCSGSKEQLVPPQSLTAPYDTSRGEVLWAVVPLRNESGTTLIEIGEVSDKVVQAAAQVRGVRVLPLNRTIAAMRALKLMELASPADAKRLATELGVDGLIVGSITAWDPYDPPKLGLALALYTRPGSMDRPSGDTLDTRRLESRPTDYQYFPQTMPDSIPASVVSEFLDGKNQQVQMDVKAYATGRHDPASALAWHRYLVSMDLYSEFAAWHTVGRLVDHEWIRLARVQARVTDR